MSRLWRLDRFGVTTLALGALLSVGVTAHALPNFSIDESSVPGYAPLGPALGGTPAVITADRFNFQYRTNGTQTIGGGNGFAGNDDPFTEVGSARVTGIQLGAGVGASGLISDQFFAGGEPLVGGFANPRYGIYALFSGAGEANPIAGGNPNGSQGITGVFSSFSVQLFLDPNRDTNSQSTPGTAAGNTGDDIQIASGTLAPAALCAPDPSCGITHTFPPGVANGDFGVLVQFLLTDDGKDYFVSPDPFYSLMEFTGVVTLITPITATRTETFGSGDAFFQVTQIPVPASLVLLGLGLVGVGATMRLGRRRA